MTKLKQQRFPVTFDKLRCPSCGSLDLMIDDFKGWSEPRPFKQIMFSMACKNCGRLFVAYGKVIIERVS